VGDRLSGRPGSATLPTGDTTVSLAFAFSSADRARLPDGAANPYIATAAVASAGLDGIDRAASLVSRQHRPVTIDTNEDRNTGNGLVASTLVEGDRCAGRGRSRAERISSKLAEDHTVERMSGIESCAHVGEWMDRAVGTGDVLGEML